MNKAIIAPSILSADFSRLGEECKNVLNAGAQWIHFDVMDNHFVPNLTIGPMVLKSLRDHGIEAPIDVHLMVQPVDELITSFAKAGASYISFHPEASKDVQASIQLIHDQGCKAGLAINPDTNLSVLDTVIKDLELVLIMSVYPGFGGQSFIESSLDKIIQVRQRLDDVNSPARLEVDGGIKESNIGAVARAGADTFVAGSAIFGQKDYALIIEEMKHATL